MNVTVVAAGLQLPGHVDRRGKELRCLLRGKRAPVIGGRRSESVHARIRRDEVDTSHFANAHNLCVLPRHCSRWMFMQEMLASRELPAVETAAEVQGSFSFCNGLAHLFNWHLVFVELTSLQLQKAVHGGLPMIHSGPRSLIMRRES